ncbi:unnamed protein product [Effrenium voratum]|nr:unnamed protein product [Effrenium voratum]
MLTHRQLLKKDSEESVLASTTPWYDELAEAEDVHALYNLGVQHELGVSGKEQDLDLARQFYRRSAEQGHPFAQNNLALLCEEPEAGQWLRRAAAQGHATAQMNLAAQVPEAEAVVWMRRAAEQLDPKAAYCLGEMYQRGYGMAPDLSEARRWYRRSADRGHFPSLTQLGLLSFEEGNFEEARGLFEAASLGDSEAFGHLVAARALLGEKPLDIWQELADEGQPEALFQLGMSYLNGEGVSVDEEKAFRLLQTAAELGHGDAAECLWHLEEEDDGEYAPALDGTSVGPRALWL